MDLGLFARVLWRFRIVSAVGLVLAITLAALSFVRVGSGGIAYRNKEQWVSYQTLLVTQRGFTEGRTDAVGADPNRLAMLAVLYSQFTTADSVVRAVWPHGLHGERLDAAPVLTLRGSSSASALPIISIAGFSDTPRRAQALTDRAARALATYVEQRQAANKIPDSKRVRLNTVATAANNAPKLWKGRSKALPLVIFLTVLIVTAGLAFVLENLRPMIRSVGEEAPRAADSVSGAS